MIGWVKKKNIILSGFSQWKIVSLFVFLIIIVIERFLETKSRTSSLEARCLVDDIRKKSIYFDSPDCRFKEESN